MKPPIICISRSRWNAVASRKNGFDWNRGNNFFAGLTGQEKRTAHWSFVMTENVQIAKEYPAAGWHLRLGLAMIVIGWIKVE